jgi:hypothetical protein
MHCSEAWEKQRHENRINDILIFHLKVKFTEHEGDMPHNTYFSVEVYSTWMQQ